MVSKETFRDILGTAVYAPSGDNSQPWRFVCKEDSIFIYNLPDRDETLYNFRQRGSYLGHGALIENVCIAAAEAGLATSVSYFPGPALCTARIDLSQTKKKEQQLYQSIRARSCNRKPYAMRPLQPVDRSEIQESVGITSVSLSIVEDREKVAQLAKAVATNERVLMENKDLHDFLFGMIRWSEKAEKKSPGLYIKTMEFPRPVQLLMRYLISHWSVLRILNMAGLSKNIAAQSGGVYASSSAICALVISNDSDPSYIDAGRVFQRIWLTATANKVSIQPITAIPYLRDRIEAGDSEMFTDEHRTMIRNAYDVMAKAFDVRLEDQYIAMVFRIGYGPPPTAVSYKMPPTIEFGDTP